MVCVHRRGACGRDCVSSAGRHWNGLSQQPAAARLAVGLRRCRGTDSAGQKRQLRVAPCTAAPLVSWLMRGSGVVRCVCVQECVPFVSQACRVGYPKRHRATHPYCFRFEGTKGAFAGTKYILAADVDAVRATFFNCFFQLLFLFAAFFGPALSCFACA